MTTTMPISTKPKRRLLRFSLRTLLLVSVVIGFGCAWVGVQLQQKRRHEAVVNEIERLGGDIFPFPYGGPIYGTPRPLIPAWKEKLFGVYVVHNWICNLEDTNANDSTLAQMKGIYCQVLHTSPKITDDGLPHLRGLKGLKELHLYGQITDDGLEHLQGLTNLQELRFLSSGVTKHGVYKLREALPYCSFYYSPSERTSDSTSE